MAPNPQQRSFNLADIVEPVPDGVVPQVCVCACMLAHTHTHMHAHSPATQAHRHTVTLSLERHNVIPCSTSELLAGIPLTDGPHAPFTHTHTHNTRTHTGTAPECQQHGVVQGGV